MQLDNEDSSAGGNSLSCDHLQSVKSDCFPRSHVNEWKGETVRLETYAFDA